MKKLYYANIYQKTNEVTIVDTLDFRVRSVSRDGERYHVMIKVL